MTSKIQAPIAAAADKLARTILTACAAASGGTAKMSWQWEYTGNGTLTLRARRPDVCDYDVPAAQAKIKHNADGTLTVDKYVYATGGYAPISSDVIPMDADCLADALRVAG